MTDKASLPPGPILRPAAWGTFVIAVLALFAGVFPFVTGLFGPTPVLIVMGLCSLIMIFTMTAPSLIPRFTGKAGVITFSKVDGGLHFAAARWVRRLWFGGCILAVVVASSLIFLDPEILGGRLSLVLVVMAGCVIFGLIDSRTWPKNPGIELRPKGVTISPLARRPVDVSWRDVCEWTGLALPTPQGPYSVTELASDQTLVLRFVRFYANNPHARAELRDERCVRRWPLHDRFVAVGRVLRLSTRRRPHRDRIRNLARTRSPAGDHRGSRFGGAPGHQARIELSD